MKALIIGGGGFVGRYLAEHLVQDCGWGDISDKAAQGECGSRGL